MFCSNDCVGLFEVSPDPLPDLAKNICNSRRCRFHCLGDLLRKDRVRGNVDNPHGMVKRKGKGETFGNLHARWWFQIFFFHPYLGKILSLTNIFQMGWNHQLACDLHEFVAESLDVFCSNKFPTRRCRRCRCWFFLFDVWWGFITL